MTEPGFALQVKNAVMPTSSVASHVHTDAQRQSVMPYPSASAICSAQAPISSQSR